jgi:hypothetical protein
MNWIERPSSSDDNISCPYNCGEDPVILKIDEFQELLLDLTRVKEEISKEPLCNPFDLEQLPIVPQPTQNPDHIQPLCIIPSFWHEGIIWDRTIEKGDWTIKVDCQIANSCAQVTGIKWINKKVHTKCGDQSKGECEVWEPGLVKSQKFKTHIQAGGYNMTRVEYDDEGEVLGPVHSVYQYKFVHPSSYHEIKLTDPAYASYHQCEKDCLVCIDSLPAYEKMTREFDMNIVLQNALTRLEKKFKDGDTFWFHTLGRPDKTVQTGSLVRIPACKEERHSEYFAEEQKICDIQFPEVETDTISYNFNQPWYVSSVGIPPSDSDLQEVCNADGTPLDVNSATKAFFLPTGEPTKLYRVDFVLRKKSETW